ncbi:hypothetical protein GCM10027093_60130 [Paraburkholderia jirisanensis]
MISYANHSGNSNVTAYEFDQNSITVQFGDGSIYLYNTNSTSPTNIAEMHRLAMAGQGLNSYIGRVVRKGYAEKIR